MIVGCWLVQQRKDFVTSVTTYQIHSASRAADDTFKIDGKDVHHVAVYGVVRRFEQKETKFVCTIEDHTGALELTHWSNNDGDDLASTVRHVTAPALP